MDTIYREGNVVKLIKSGKKGTIVRIDYKSSHPFSIKVDGDSSTVDDDADLVWDVKEGSFFSDQPIKFPEGTHVRVTKGYHKGREGIVVGHCETDGWDKDDGWRKIAKVDFFMPNEVDGLYGEGYLEALEVPGENF